MAEHVLRKYHQVKQVEQAVVDVEQYRLLRPDLAAPAQPRQQEIHAIGQDQDAPFDPAVSPLHRPGIDRDSSLIQDILLCGFSHWSLRLMLLRIRNRPGYKVADINESGFGILAKRLLAPAE